MRWIPLLLLAACATSVRREEDVRAPDSDVLREALRGGDPAAARAMGRIQSPAYVADLVAALDGPAREEAIFALGQIPGATVPAELLADESVRGLVLEALGKLGGDEATIASYVPHPESITALFRLRYGKHIETYSPATLDALRAAARHADPEVRRRVAYAVSRWPDPEICTTLARDPDLWTRVFAVRGQFDEAALRDPEYLVRVEAVNAAAKAGLIDAILAAAPAETNPHVMAAMIRAAGAGAYHRGFMDSVMVQAEVLRATDDVENASHPWELVQVLSNPATRADPRPYVDHENLMVASAAVGALKDPAAVAAILADPSRPLEVRGSAVEVVAALKDALLREPLRRCYANSRAREFVEVRESIVDAAKALDDREFLETLARDPSPSVRIKAAEALGREAEPAPPPRASPFLGVTFAANPVVVLETDRGEIEIECFADDAPIHVASFVDLVRRGTYDGLIWHRVVSNFVIQGGDPRGSGWGDAGYNLRDEINRRRFERGVVGMPKAGKDTGGCQIFITHTPTPHLDGRYTVFGRVVRGLDVVDAIEPCDRIVRARVLE